MINLSYTFDQNYFTYYRIQNTSKPSISIYNSYAFNQFYKMYSINQCSTNFEYIESPNEICNNHGEFVKQNGIDHCLCETKFKGESCNECNGNWTGDDCNTCPDDP
mgnify:CR=1 FL=1